MTDMHCHIIPGVDDGAQTIEEMESMFEIAYEDGIRRICATPHYKEQEFENDDEIFKHNEKVEANFLLAKKYLEEHHPDMSLVLGNEIMYHNDIYASIKAGKCRKLNNSSFLLMEFIPGASYFEIENAVNSVMRKGIRPLIAHVERYNALLEKPSRVKDLKDSGALIQINASSIVKFRFGQTARFIKKLFKNSLVDVVASDAHSPRNHKPVLSDAYEIVEKKYGAKVAKRVFCDKPNKILDNIKFF